MTAPVIDDIVNLGGREAEWADDELPANSDHSVKSKNLEQVPVSELIQSNSDLLYL